ncbi:hypothetical protein [Nocardiopsis sp. JB363]|uniref:hypothetical protein n=1 Tax=Nocardiopsis sp. JB363 TaxID=1434837 RepID=UPI002100B94F|nr:hypothetical protein [Nocardiopsis sp. JB363]
MVHHCPRLPLKRFVPFGFPLTGLLWKIARNRHRTTHITNLITTPSTPALKVVAERSRASSGRPPHRATGLPPRGARHPHRPGLAPGFGKGASAQLPSRHRLGRRPRRRRGHRVAVARLHPSWSRWVYDDVSVLTQVDDGHPCYPDGRGERATSSTSQPSLVIEMLQALNVGEGMSVLEIGTATGYNCALLCVSGWAPSARVRGGRPGPGRMLGHRPRQRHQRMGARPLRRCGGGRAAVGAVQTGHLLSEGPPTALRGGAQESAHEQPKPYRQSGGGQVCGVAPV